MEWLNSLFFEHTPLQAVVILSIIIAVGLGLGKIHLFGISLGVTFVFFAGILAGHLGFSIDPNMLNYAESFGLVLFVYELGLQVGPGFFSSFRKGGVQLNMLGIGVILAGTVMTVLFSKLGGIPMSDMVGILCGATTNTPALGAAQQTLKQMGFSCTPTRITRSCSSLKSNNPTSSVCYRFWRNVFSRCAAVFSGYAARKSAISDFAVSKSARFS